MWTRLSEFGIFFLDRWRMRADLIEVYRMTGDTDRVDSQKLLGQMEDER